MPVVSPDRDSLDFIAHDCLLAVNMREHETQSVGSSYLPTRPGPSSSNHIFKGRKCFDSFEGRVPANKNIKALKALSLARKCFQWQDMLHKFDGITCV